MPNDYKHLLDAPRSALDRMVNHAGRARSADPWAAARTRTVGATGAPSSTAAGPGSERAATVDAGASAMKSGAAR